MTTILQDAFTGSDGTSLDAHAPNVAPGGAVWVERLGNWQITSNAAALAVATNGGHATIETGEADCTITVEANSTTTSTISTRDVGIIARWVDVDNHFRIGINAEADQFRIIERAAGVNTIRATIAVTITPGTLYTVQAVLNGATITATLDGANEISYGSATAGQSSTVHGIAVRETADRIDDFAVEFEEILEPDYPATRRFGAELVHFSSVRRFDTEDVYISESRDLDAEEVYAVNSRRPSAKEVYEVPQRTARAIKVYISGAEPS